MNKLYVLIRELIIISICKARYFVRRDYPKCMYTHTHTCARARAHIHTRITLETRHHKHKLSPGTRVNTGYINSTKGPSSKAPVPNKPYGFCAPCFTYFYHPQIKGRPLMADTGVYNIRQNQFLVKFRPSASFDLVTGSRYKHTYRMYTV